MHEFILKMKRAVENPWLEAGLGLIIMATGLAEVGDSLFEDVSTGKVGARHGVIILGLVHTIKAAQSILGGLMIFAHGADRDKH